MEEKSSGEEDDVKPVHLDKKGDEGKTDDEILQENMKRFFLINKPRYKSESILCRKCRDFNFKDKDRHSIHEGRLYEYTSYCRKCVQMNIMIGDMHSNIQKMN